MARSDSSLPGNDSGVVQLLLRMLDERHPGLSDHVGDVTDLATGCARALGLPPELVQDIHATAELHDIGKIAIPASILAKPGALSDHEWDRVRGHTVIGQWVLSALPSMRGVGKLVRSSHERWDGTGYPDRLAGDDIPIGARIVTVADAFCAMTEQRVYSPSRTPEDAIGELKRCAGTQFDPSLVDVFCDVVAQRDIDEDIPLASCVGADEE